MINSTKQTGNKTKQINFNPNSVSIEVQFGRLLIEIF